MTSLYQLYNQKAKNGTGTTTKKTYMVPYEELYLEPGDNIRPLNQMWAEHMRDLWISGADLPALTVEVTEKGVKITDGQHRFIGAGLAREMGINIPRIECKDFVGTELERLAHQDGSNNSLALTPIQRAQQYNRARNLGYSVQEIAKAFHRSPAHIEDYLQLLSAGKELIDMVESGEIAHTTAVAMSREHGPKAPAVAKEKLEKAKAGGKKKLTRAAALPQFSATRARRLCELLYDAAPMVREEGDVLLLLPGTREEINTIPNEYRQQHPQVFDEEERGDK
ncbi:DNA-binding protein [Serratia marcescens]|uniref:DNA-binding protein n=1 Tax=Serratia marcescens TaxID=615 RepID=UPI00124A6C6A|nr:DNA-binding protein [Serratia marcescens]KAB1578725.1 DNA-binding protein [Serratia marcescens]